MYWISRTMIYLVANIFSENFKKVLQIACIKISQDDSNSRTIFMISYKLLKCVVVEESVLNGEIGEVLEWSVVV